MAYEQRFLRLAKCLAVQRLGKKLNDVVLHIEESLQPGLINSVIEELRRSAHAQALDDIAAEDVRKTQTLLGDQSAPEQRREEERHAAAVARWMHQENALAELRDEAKTVASRV